MKRFAASLMCLTLLGACETTSSAPPVGASVLRLETDRYRITFRGVSGAGSEEVRDRAMLRAADLALMQGYDWLEVTGRSVDVAPSTTPRITFGIGGASFGRGGGFGLGASQSTGGEITYVARLEVLLHHGQRPLAPNAYDAREITANLGPRLAPPPR